MLNRKVRILAVPGITIVAAAMVTLSTTSASAATTTVSASGHVSTPRAPEAAADASGCVTEDFSIADENTYEPCVVDEQILLNDIRIDGGGGPNQVLTVDGYYGPDTTSDVTSFQRFWHLSIDGITGPQTWSELCAVDKDLGFTGVYWHGAGCATE